MDMKMKKLLFMLPLLLAVLLAAGCDREPRERTLEPSQCKVYYSNTAGTGVDWVACTPQTENGPARIDELLEQLDSIPEERDLKLTKPEVVALNAHTLKDGNLQLDFGENYGEVMDAEEDMLLRTAYVLTLTQVDGVDTVEFLSGGVPLKDSEGKPLPPASADDFITSTREEINAYNSETYTIYFAGSSGDKLVEKKVSGIYSTSIAPERIVMDAIMAGPDDQQMKQVIPEGTKLLSVSAVDGICYVNFTEQFLQPMPDVTQKASIYAIVNSLCELDGVEQVQFSINGEVNREIVQELNLGSPFTFNDDIVEEE